MSAIFDILKAGQVIRWHTNCWLSGTNDRNAGHQWRVACYLRKLHPKITLDLMTAALIHDGGEWAVGDVSATVKDKYPDLAVWLAKIERDALEAIFGAFPDLPEHDARWLHFADRLDSWVWAKHHNTPMDRDGWPAATSWLHSEAQMLGVVDDWVELVRWME
jgi:hypothetical protein